MMKVIVLSLLYAGAAYGQCGVERASVKQLRDNPKLLPVRVATVKELANVPLVVVGNTTPRSKFETQEVKVTATLVGYKLEADRDIHMVLRDSGKTIIVESIDPDCPYLKSSPYESDYREVRAWIAAHLLKPTAKYRKVSKRVTVTGVLFTDRLHGQTGVAKSGVEIHPILSIE